MMRRILWPLALVAIATAPVRAQKTTDPSRASTSNGPELARIQADLEIVKTQLAEVLRLLQRAPASATRTVAAERVRATLGEAPSLGRRDAPVTVVEFSDYQCPFCQRFFATTLRTLITEYVDAGKVRYVLRDHPLDQLHPHARRAAEATHCAGDQGKYWEMHDALFRSGGALAPEQLSAHARALGLDGAQFDECVGSGRHAADVQRGIADGVAAGVQATPTFVIGRSGGGDIVEGTMVRGAQPIEIFRRIIEQALARR